MQVATPERKKVRCKNCQAIVAEESDEAFVLGTISVQEQFKFVCRSCHTKNSWKSDNFLLREEVDRLTKITVYQAKDLETLKTVNDTVITVTKQLESANKDLEIQRQLLNEANKQLVLVKAELEAEKKKVKK